MSWWSLLFGNKKPRQILAYHLASADEDYVRRKWMDVADLIKIGKPSQLRQAIIESDKLLDFVLSKLVAGTSLGERLKNARELFNREDYDRAWQAHKVRNALVHESAYEPPYYVCKEALEKFRTALVSLNVRI